MNILKTCKGFKVIVLSIGTALFYGCVQSMSKGNLRTPAISNEPIDLPIKETVSNNPDLVNIASLAIIILILGLLFWKKGSTCDKSSNK